MINEDISAADLVKNFISRVVPHPLWGSGRICGFGDDDIIVGFNHTKGWISSRGEEIILQEYISYGYTPKSKVIEFLNEHL